MASPRKSRLTPSGFDVVCSIGRVEFDSSSGKTPYETAFDLIGSHGANGVFSFPAEDGGEILVTVEHLSDNLR